MTDPIDVRTNPRSRGAIAHRMPEEVGAPCTKRVLNFGPPMRTPEVLAINPMGKVPVIRHRAPIITEGAAICAYQVGAFRDSGLTPPPGQRAACDRLLCFGAGPREAASTNRALGVEVPPERPEMVGDGDFDMVIAALDQAVTASSYPSDDTFSAADVQTGSHIGSGLMFGTIPDRPAFRDDRARITTRPAYARTQTQA